MATRRTTFGKQERERAKRTKAAAKRDRRLEKDTEGGEGNDAAGTPPSGERNPQFVAHLMDQLERLHRQFEAHELGYEEFEEKKVLLLAQLPID